MRAKSYADFCTSIAPQVQALISELQLRATKTRWYSLCFVSLRVGISTHRSGRISGLSSTRRILGGFHPSKTLKHIGMTKGSMFVSCLNLFESSNFKPKKSWCFRSSSVSSRCSQETKKLWPHKMVLYNGNINAKSKYKLTMNEVDQLPRSFFWVAYITYINDSMPQRSTLKGWDWHSYLCSPVLSAGTPNKTWEIEWRIRNARQWSRKQTSF